MERFIPLDSYNTSPSYFRLLYVGDLCSLFVSICNLMFALCEGMYGIQSAAAIVLPPQACALSLGAIVDTVVPNTSPKEGEDVWKVRLRSPTTTTPPLYFFSFHFYSTQPLLLLPHRCFHQLQLLPLKRTTTKCLYMYLLSSH